MCLKKQNADLGRDGVVLGLLADFSSLSLCSFFGRFFGGLLVVTLFIIIGHSSSSGERNCALKE